MHVIIAKDRVDHAIQLYIEEVLKLLISTLNNLNTINCTNASLNGLYIYIYMLTESISINHQEV